MSADSRLVLGQPNSDSKFVECVNPIKPFVFPHVDGCQRRLIVQFVEFSSRSQRSNQNLNRLLSKYQDAHGDQQMLSR